MLLSLYKYSLGKFKGELTLEQATKARNDESSYKNLVTRDDLHLITDVVLLFRSLELAHCEFSLFLVHCGG